MKLSQILAMIPSIKKIMEKELPFSLSYKFSKLIDILNKNEEWYHSEMQKLVEKYAERDKNNNIKQDENSNIILQRDKQPEFYQKIDELVDIEVDDKLPEFVIDELKDITISPADLHKLMPLIKE